MLDAIRVTLIAYTASFRVPHFVGHQLTLPVPPLSTVYGLLSAAAGHWVMPNDVEWLAYRFVYEEKARDLEAILTVDRSKPEDTPRFAARNVLPREFLVMPRLFVYLPPQWEGVFRRPRYSLLLGRTQDVASVEEIGVVKLESVASGVVSGVLLPFELVARGRVPAWLQNLPVAFTNEPLRRAVRMHVFGIVDAHRHGEVHDGDGWLFRDMESGITVPLYQKEWVLYGGSGASGKVA